MAPILPLAGPLKAKGPLGGHFATGENPVNNYFCKTLA
jgi:hypothetical protein